jgi:hypothetical protein
MLFLFPCMLYAQKKFIFSENPETAILFDTALMVEKKSINRVVKEYSVFDKRSIASKTIVVFDRMEGIRVIDTFTKNGNRYYHYYFK